MYYLEPKKEDTKKPANKSKGDVQGSKAVAADTTSLEVTGLKSSQLYELIVYALAGPETSEPVSVHASTSKSLIHS